MFHSTRRTACAALDAGGLRATAGRWSRQCVGRRHLQTPQPGDVIAALCKAADNGNMATVKALATRLTDDVLLHQVMAQRASMVNAASMQGKETREEKRRHHDATATKPTAVCDPYENKGQPLSAAQCMQLMPTVSDAWRLAVDNSSLVREIEVDNFMKGAQLLTTLAAVSFNDGHFPLLTLERRLGRGRRWQEVVVVTCRTSVLDGLSYRDFLLALLMDAELDKLI